MAETALPWLHAQARAFAHGFGMPFRLARALLADQALRGPYLRLVAVRAAVVLVLFGVALATGELDPKDRPEHTGGLVIRHDATPGADAGPGIHLHVPGLTFDVDDGPDADVVEVFGTRVPVDVRHVRREAKEADAAETRDAEDGAPPVPPSLVGGWNQLHDGWKWVVAVVAFLSVAEGVVVFFSRRWDDHLSFHAARLAAIRPEDDAPKDVKLAVDLKWLHRKLKRRIRGYVLFASGMPLLLALRLLPLLGDAAFALLSAAWGYYWLGVFTAAKSAHAWRAPEAATSPAPIRAFNRRAPTHRLFAPVRLYGRTWARVTRELDPAATTFERAPAAFLGLALARALLALPGLYLLARPVVPLAAGRLCAEVEPAGALWLAAPSSDLPSSESGLY